MKQLISFETAGKILLTILIGLIFFHILVLTGIIPKDIVWAGSIQDKQDLIKKESLSLVILSVVILIVLLKLRHINSFLPAKLIDIAMWLPVILFSLNTLGNLTALHPLERYGFGLLTLIMAFLSLRLALEKRSK